MSLSTEWSFSSNFNPSRDFASLCAIIWVVTTFLDFLYFKFGDLGLIKEDSFRELILNEAVWNLLLKHIWLLMLRILFKLSCLSWFRRLIEVCFCLVSLQSTLWKHCLHLPISSRHLVSSELNIDSPIIVLHIRFFCNDWFCCV